MASIQHLSKGYGAGALCRKYLYESAEPHQAILDWIYLLKGYTTNN